MDQTRTQQPIYHYTKAKSGLNILFEKKLRLNKIGKTNDPRESQLWILPTFLEQPNNLDVADVIKEANDVIHNDIPRVIEDEWKVACFTLEGSSQNEQTNKVFKRMFAAFLDPGYSHPRMWAQYGESHKGVCLQFDQHELHNKLKKSFGERCFPGPVNYDGSTVGSYSINPPATSNIINDIKNLGSKDTARKYVTDNYQAFFLKKNPDWAGEAEYRWLVHSPNSEFEEVSIEGAIIGIIVGMDFSRIYDPSLKTFCRELGIWAKRMKWHNGLPEPIENFEIIFESKSQSETIC